MDRERGRRVCGGVSIGRGKRVCGWCVNRERGRRVCERCAKQGDGEEGVLGVSTGRGGGGYVGGVPNRERGRRVSKKEERSMNCNRRIYL